MRTALIVTAAVAAAWNAALSGDAPAPEPIAVSFEEDKTQVRLSVEDGALRVAARRPYDIAITDNVEMVGAPNELKPMVLWDGDDTYHIDLEIN